MAPFRFQPRSNPTFPRRQGFYVEGLVPWAVTLLSIAADTNHSIKVSNCHRACFIVKAIACECIDFLLGFHSAVDCYPTSHLQSIVSKVHLRHSLHYATHRPWSTRALVTAKQSSTRLISPRQTRRALLCVIARIARYDPWSSYLAMFGTPIEICACASNPIDSLLSHMWIPLSYEPY